MTTIAEDPAAHTLAPIRDYLVLGAGPGTFYVAFPRYRPEKVVKFYDYTHNDYAQLASARVVGKDREALSSHAPESHRDPSHACR